MATTMIEDDDDDDDNADGDVGDHVDDDGDDADDDCRDVDAVSNPFAAFKDKLEEKSWEQVYTKMQAWTLVEYERVVFLDADQL
eukprot:755942-Hanusia_phi.AAC.1